MKILAYIILVSGVSIGYIVRPMVDKLRAKYREWKKIKKTGERDKCLGI